MRLPQLSPSIGLYRENATLLTPGIAPIVCGMRLYARGDSFRRRDPKDDIERRNVSTVRAEAEVLSLQILETPRKQPRRRDER
jgi:hypothetical protein